MFAFSRRRETAVLALVAALYALPGLAAQPDEGDCPTVSGSASDGPQIDAVPITLREGMVLTADDLLILRQLVPQEIWRHRTSFFFEGMRMEIGPCHRRYPVNGFFEQATHRFGGTARLDDEGNLENYTAGLPFPAASIDPSAADAATRWAWNMAMRFRGAGPHGRFRIVDFPSSVGRPETYEGSIYELLAQKRADLADQGFALAEGKRLLWAAGGVFRKPFNARHLAWRQFRSLKSLQRFRDSDDVFVYVPSMRKVRRAAAPWTDGLYVPSYSVTGGTGGGAVAFGEGGSVNPTAGSSIAATEDRRSGFSGLVLRPNSYQWRLLGEQDVLAPLNSAHAGWPHNPDRNFGPSGLAVASDRWDVRRAVLIEGAMRHPGESIRTVTYYVDRQTLQPLYRFTRAGRRRALAVEILVHRFSGDVAAYPEWPGRGRTFVFDPVAQVSFNASEGRGGWRRESYDLVSIPYDSGKPAGMLSSSALVRGH